MSDDVYCYHCRQADLDCFCPSPKMDAEAYIDELREEIRELKAKQFSIQSTLNQERRRFDRVVQEEDGPDGLRAKLSFWDKFSVQEVTPVVDDVMFGNPSSPTREVEYVPGLARFIVTLKSHSVLDSSDMDCLIHWMEKGVAGGTVDMMESGPMEFDFRFRHAGGTIENDDGSG